ncbi:D-glycero-beta-D-manno-heptose 1-phosphate adenylyltransferase [Chitinophaga sp. NPDC101104]|uniref:D-glycero-beta-D-manno-heptose 1-phosphate adenylyltransferase n=1 Tax=Chitinophaga sp. NPDC101104 TaxID=3390561 RepID=UPI003D03E1F5
MYQQIISRFTSCAVLVIGDLIIDRYLHGQSHRLCPEGPVPVVEMTEASEAPGGAANTAVNLRELGAAVTFCSVAGADENGRHAQAMLESRGIAARFVFAEERRSIVKSRVLAGRQLVARLDEGTETPLSPATESAFIELLETASDGHCAIVIADYGKGVFTPGVIAALEKIRRRTEVYLAVDSRHAEVFKRLRPSLVKPNYQEALLLMGQTASANRPAQVKAAAAGICAATGAAVAAVTLDEDGAVIIAGGIPQATLPARPVSHPNVNGAGDAYISAFTLAAVCGAEAAESAWLAGEAAAIAISRPGTAYCSHAELLAQAAATGKLLYSAVEAAALSSYYKSLGKKVVFTNGCFDILHSGHVACLEAAAELGDVLIVGVNSDAGIRRNKGAHRPINALKERIQVLAGLSAITHLISFEEDTPVSLISAIRPDVFVKGGDYAGKELPEASLVKQLGGEVRLLPLVPGRSTTSVIRRIHSDPVLKSV